MGTVGPSLRSLCREPELRGLHDKSFRRATLMEEKRLKGRLRQGFQVKRREAHELTHWPYQRQRKGRRTLQGAEFDSTRRRGSYANHLHSFTKSGDGVDEDDVSGWFAWRCSFAAPLMTGPFVR